MKRHVAGCVAVLVAGWACAEKEAEWPLQAKQSLTRMEASIVQAKKKAVTELAAVQSSESRAGHLEVALRVSEMIKTLNAEIEKMEAQPLAKRPNVALPGKWRMHNTVLVSLEKDNTFSAGIGTLKWSGKWRTEDEKLVVDGVLIVDTYDLPPKRETRDGKSVWVLSGRNSKNEPISMVKEE